MHKHVETGNLAVLGIVFTIGSHNPWIQKLLDVIPSEELENSTLPEINPYEIIPSDDSLYSYYVIQFCEIVLD